MLPVEACCAADKRLYLNNIFDAVKVTDKRANGGQHIDDAEPGCLLCLLQCDRITHLAGVQQRTVLFHGDLTGDEQRVSELLYRNVHGFRSRLLRKANAQFHQFLFYIHFCYLFSILSYTFILH